MNLNDPVVIALLRLYAKHHWFFCDLYNCRFRLITSWLTEEATGYRNIEDTVSNPTPWYARSTEVIKLAEILKVSTGELYAKLKELES